jgi:hypothetical protein
VSRVRAVVLGAFLAVVSVLGVMPAASAAPLTAITWEGSGGTLTIQSGWARVCPTGGGSFAPGQTLQVQVLTGSTWVTKKAYAAPAVTYSYVCIDVSPFDLVAKPGRYSIRAFTQAAPGAPVMTADAVVTVGAAPVYMWTETVELTSTTASKWVTVSVDLPRGQILELQRREGPGYRTVSRVAAPRTGEHADVRLPVATRAGQATYRVVSHATAWTALSASGSFGIHQTDYARYAGYIATARRHIASYCPKTPISIDTPAVAGGSSRIGQAASSYQTSSARGQSYLKASIELRSGLSATSLKHTALHECAHVVQFRAIVEKRDAVDEQRANQIYGAAGIEAQADCMAVLYSKAPSQMYYIHSCSAAQMTEGHRIWRAYGLKYQAATYTW